MEKSEIEYTGDKESVSDALQDFQRAKIYYKDLGYVDGAMRGEWLTPPPVQHEPN